MAGSKEEPKVYDESVFEDSQTSGNSLVALHNTYLLMRFHTSPILYPASQPLSPSRLTSIPTLPSILLASHFTSITSGQSSDGETPLKRNYTRKILEESARIIKDLDANHLVTTGAEGKNGKDWKCASAAIL
ncbi:7198_t:CDS:2, partial [Paraglomus brasilianum]